MLYSINPTIALPQSSRWLPAFKDHSAGLTLDKPFSNLAYLPPAILFNAPSTVYWFVPSIPYLANSSASSSAYLVTPFNLIGTFI